MKQRRAQAQPRALPAGEPIVWTPRAMAMRLEAPSDVPAVIISCKPHLTLNEVAQELRTLAAMLEPA